MRIMDKNAVYELERGGRRYAFECWEGVKGRDYYEESMTKHFSEILPVRDTGSQVEILNVGAGHGLSAVVLANARSVGRVVASDINPLAVELVGHNAERNGVCGNVHLRHHDKLFDAVGRSERFDGIVAALPPVPVTAERLRSYPQKVRSHHWPTKWGVGGSDGRRLIDHLISEAPRHLKRGGFLMHVHADFIGTGATIELMDSCGFDTSVAGGELVCLEDTELTLRQRDVIESLGYTFKLRDDRLHFCVETFVGRLRNGRELPKAEIEKVS